MTTTITTGPISITGECNKCGENTKFVVAMQIIRSGASFFLWWCTQCQKPHQAGQWIEKEWVINSMPEGATLEDIPLAKFACGDRCAKCGSRGTEKHHWAPQALFKNADEWPTDYLCKACHDKWHEIINPKMIKWALKQIPQSTHHANT